MSIFRLLHLRRFFEHRFRTLLSLTGIGIGSALVVAVLGMFGSLDSSIDEFVDGLTGVADIEITGTSAEGFDEKLIFAVTETEGIKNAVPLVQDSILIGGQQGSSKKRAIIVGLDQRAEALGTRLSEEEATRIRARASGRIGLFVGERLAGQARLGEGDVARVYTNAGEREVDIVGVISGEAGGFNQGLFAATALPIAQTITGKVGRLDSVLIVLNEGADEAAVQRRLAEIVGTSAQVASPQRRADEARTMTNDLRAGMLMAVSMALVVGAFLIFNTMNMAATERRRELATLRALGGRRRRLLTMFLLEAGAVGLIGSALGAVAGVFIAQVMVDSIPPFVRSVIGIELRFKLPAYAIPAGIASGVVASVLASLVPARRAMGVSPVESMRPEGVLESLDGGEKIAPVSTLFGIALMVLGFIGAYNLSGGLAFFGVAVLLGGVIFTSYGLTAPLAMATAGVAARAGVAGRLAAAAIQRAPRRSWATTVAVLTATGMVVAQGGLFGNLNNSLREIIEPLTNIDLYVSAQIEGLGTDVQLPGDWRDDFEAIPGVAEVGMNTFRFVTYRNESVLLQGLEGWTRDAPQLQGLSAEQRTKVEMGEAATVSTRFSELYGVDAGDRIILPTPTGTRSFEVIGAIPSFAWERGLITVGRRVFVEDFDHEAVGDYSLTFEAGADPEQIRADVQNLVASSPIKPFLVPGDQFLEIALGTVDQINALFSAMTTIVIGAAALAILNSLLISIVERRRELGIMRAIGTSRRQLRRMVVVEAGAIGIVGAVVGAAMGFLLHLASMGPIMGQSGFPVEYQFTPSPTGIAFLIGVGIAIVSSVLPAKRAGSINIIEAIGYE